MTEPNATEQRLAVIGMACRFPGAEDLAAFWHLLAEGREGLTRYADAQLPAEPRDDSAFVPVDGALDRPAAFDAEFFGLTPAEADLTDPQHRLFLECAWQALEDAGHAPGTGTRRIGVFAGASHTSYRADRITGHPHAARQWHPVQVAVGNDIDTIPLRVSYRLGLTGPSMTVQTACSSALVAVHLAGQSLLLGESDLALAGAASVRILEPTGYRYEEGGILSRDGHCRPFDAAADGTVPADGVGVVVLKRLDDALRDGDHIRAIVLGTSVNNDGAAKLGFTAPSIAGQAAVIADALAVADVDPDTIDYVEAHGTATPLGDPIEAQALAEALRTGGRTDPCLVGSVKSNIGHPDAAAGIAGLIKTVLALEHRFVPPTRHFATPNPRAELAGNGLRVSADGTAWPGSDHPARAGVSSFGFGGTNVHLVLEAAPPVPASAGDGWQVLPLSARTPDALDARCARLAGLLDARPDTNLADVAWTLQVGHTPFPVRRAYVVGPDTAHAQDTLSARSTASTASTARTDPPVAFLLPGQGSQYPGMGAELYRDQPVFRVAVAECAELFGPHLDVDLHEILFADDPDAGTRLAQTRYTQPAIFTVEVALARLLADRGVRPTALLGHSLGELTAAHLAGVYTMDDAVTVVAARAALSQATAPGTMLAVPLPEAALRDLLGDLLTDDPDHCAAIAAVNAPTTCVVAGAAAGIARIRARLAGHGTAWRELETSHAFHTALLEPALPAFARVLRQVRLAPPRIPFLSNMTGTWITDDQATDPDYWTRQIREPVRFAAGMATLLGGDPVLVEVGPGTALGGFARPHRDAAGRRIAPAALLRRSRTEPVGEEQSVLAGLAALWEQGVAVDWTAPHRGTARRRVPLPTYPFQRREHLLPRLRHADSVAMPAEPVSAVDPPATPAAPTGSGPDRDELDVAVADVWREVLGIEDISPDDNFYEIGGNSLYAIQIVGRLRALEPELPLGLVFTAPSVAELAAAIRSRRDIDLRDVDPAELAALLDEIEGLARPTEGGAV